MTGVQTPSCIGLLFAVCLSHSQPSLGLGLQRDDDANSTPSHIKMEFVSWVPRWRCVLRWLTTLLHERMADDLFDDTLRDAILGCRRRHQNVDNLFLNPLHDLNLSNFLNDNFLQSRDSHDVLGRLPCNDLILKDLVVLGRGKLFQGRKRTNDLLCRSLHRSGGKLGFRQTCDV